MIDHDNFIYFHDRVGDTFRWVSLNYGETCTSWHTPKLINPIPFWLWYSIFFYLFSMSIQPPVFLEKKEQNI